MVQLHIIVVACLLGLVSSLKHPEVIDEDKTSFIISAEDDMDSADGAFRICSGYGGKVPVTIQTAAKHLEVTRYMSSYKIGSVWTAGDDLQLNGRNKYEWTVDTSGTRVPFQYLGWLNGAPLKDDGCRCVSFVSGVHGSCGNQTSCAGMTVEPCDLQRRVLCEKAKSHCEK